MRIGIEKKLPSISEEKSKGIKNRGYSSIVFNVDSSRFPPALSSRICSVAQMIHREQAQPFQVSYN